jgi:hypothetical protein
LGLDVGDERTGQSYSDRTMRIALVRPTWPRRAVQAGVVVGLATAR